MFHNTGDKYPFLVGLHARIESSQGRCTLASEVILTIMFSPLWVPCDIYFLSLVCNLGTFCLGDSFLLWILGLIIRERRGVGK